MSSTLSMAIGEIRGPGQRIEYVCRARPRASTRAISAYLNVDHVLVTKIRGRLVSAGVLQRVSPLSTVGVDDSTIDEVNDA